jgi:hypothetical protein
LNPRTPFGVVGFQDRCNRPLCHPSEDCKLFTNRTLSDEFAGHSVNRCQSKRLKRGPQGKRHGARQTKVFDQLVRGKGSPRNAHKKIKMPPGKPLSDAVVNDLAIWVRDGTSWPKGAATEERDTHWAFEPVRVVEPPPDPSATSLVL